MNPFKERTKGLIFLMAPNPEDSCAALLVSGLAAAGYRVERMGSDAMPEGVAAERKPVAVLFDGTAMGDEALAGWERLTGPFALSRPALILFADRNRLPLLDSGHAAEADEVIVLPTDAGEIEFRLQAAIGERGRRLEGETRLHVLSHEHQEARRATEAKSEFLARMSHELRTPLNGIISAAELLGETRLEGDQVPLVETLKSSGEQLLALINNVLDYSRIESGRMEIDSRPFDPARCALRVVDMVATRVAGKNVELLAQYPPDLPLSVMGDPLRLQQVLLNLVGNAVKFTTSGEILLGVSVVSADDPTDGTTPAVRMMFEVSDTGAGIPQEAQARLFNAFEQGGAGVAREFGGSGLGLSIARHLVGLMGGNLQFESEEGRGTRFHFTLQFPLRCANRKQASPLLRGRRLLLLETHPASAAMLELHARAWGMDVTRAARPGEAFAGPGEPQHQDAVIADELVMESILGDVMARLKASSPEACPPLILLSRLHSKRQHDSALPPRALPMLKPVKVDEVRRQLEGLLAEPVAAAECVPTPDRAPKLDALPPIKVLLVDDNEINLSVGQRMLRRVGIEADLAVNGEEAVRAVQRGQYDLVFMDVQMPVMNGLDATRAIRSVQEFAVRPVIIAMTANSLAGDREICLAAGMQDYLSKPIRPEDVELKVQAWMPRLAGAGSVAALPPATGSTPPDGNDVAVAPPECPVDMERLEYFSAGDSSALRDIVGLYFQQAEKQIAELLDCVERGEAERVRALAHNCVGASATCGMREVLAPLRELERMGKEGELAAASEPLQAAGSALSRARSFLQEEGCI